MGEDVKRIALEKLVAHPDNPNRMSVANFNKLVRNIKRVGRYEPLVVRCSVESEDCFQIINGHHRARALAQLGHEFADCIVWDVDDLQVDILLVTLNRLGGTDEVSKKLALLRRLSGKSKSAELAKILPHSAEQIKRLSNLKRPDGPSVNTKSFASTLVFFVDDSQERIVEEALSGVVAGDGKISRAAKRAAALAQMAECFLELRAGDKSKVKIGLES